MIIPFQVIMDFIFFNIEYWYNGLNLNEAMAHWMRNFQMRENNWIGLDDEQLEYEEVKRELYKQCYSPQCYFIMTIATSATLIVLFGIMGVINSNFDPF